MKRILMLSLVMICFTALLYAKGPKQVMDGTICNSQCVSQVSNRATCDPTCTDTSGDTVFVNDSGAVAPVANPDICQSHMGKHVKMTATQVSGQPGAVQVQQLQDTPQPPAHSY